MVYLVLMQILESGEFSTLLIFFFAKHTYTFLGKLFYKKYASIFLRALEQFELRAVFDCLNRFA